MAKSRYEAIQKMSIETMAEFLEFVLSPEFEGELENCNDFKDYLEEEAEGIFFEEL